jgi:hypothetical protein
MQKSGQTRPPHRVSTVWKHGEAPRRGSCSKSSCTRAERSALRPHQGAPQRPVSSRPYLSSHFFPRLSIVSWSHHPSKLYHPSPPSSPFCPSPRPTPSPRHRREFLGGELGIHRLVSYSSSFPARRASGTSRCHWFHGHCHLIPSCRQKRPGLVGCQPL